MNVVFYFSICAAFIVNAWFLGTWLFSGMKRAGWKKSLGAAVPAAVLFACCQAFYYGTIPRGGYDNDHDFQYQSISFFRPGSIASAMSVKEASPLIMDGISDALSGFSLKAALAKNSLLMLLSALVLAVCLYRLGFGLNSALFGFVLFYFNFLTVLNANAFSTTAANIFFLCCALYAAAVFETERRDLKGLLWVLAAFILVWTGRYELAFMPGVLLFVSLLRRDGALRSLVTRPGAAAWICFGLAAAICAAWTGLVIAQTPYNGPPPGESLRLLEHLRYQLGDRNLGLLAPFPAGLAVYLVTAAFAVIFASAWFSARRVTRPAFFWTLLLWTICFSSIFMLRDSYPLHFMRHQLYFFMPFVFLFAAAFDACLGFIGTGPGAVRAGRIVLICFCAVYLKANAGIVHSMEREQRTNDMEWALLLKASENWPKGCALMYPARDRYNRYYLLKKYFPLLPDNCGGPVPECVIKYLPPIYRIYGGSGLDVPEGYSPASPSYAPPGAHALYEAVFAHRFYTLRDFETREAVPLRIGFYYADSPEDKAWLAAREAPCLDPKVAIATFRKMRDGR